MGKARIVLLLSLLLLAAGCVGKAPNTRIAPPSAATIVTASGRGTPGSFEIESAAFSDGGTIPDRFAACGHPNVSPEIRWSGVPDGTKSLVLCAVDRVDMVWTNVPKGSAFVHWAVFGIPAKYDGLKENVPKRPRLQGGVMQGKNWEHKWGYSGPCPPRGQKHFYFFTLYALDEASSVEPEQGRDLCLALGGLRPVRPRAGEMDAIRKLAASLNGHVLAATTLRGTYGER